MAEIFPMVTDTSHWDPIEDADAVKRDGIVGCIIKATEGQTYSDPTYVEQQHMIKNAGLKFGSYHFADASNVNGQIDNYLRFAAPTPDELFCLDWEDNPSGNGMMPVTDVQIWITEVERQLHREGQCVLYSGNTAKDQLGEVVSPFFGERRLWLAHYSSSPSWQASWQRFWLWQFTDGENGPQPHAIAGIGPCDINSYQGTVDRLIAEWATGSAERPPQPRPPRPEPRPVVSVAITVPAGVELELSVNGEPLLI